MFKLLQQFFDILRRLLHVYPINYFDLLEEYEDDVSGFDLSKRDTLVGTVKSFEQYCINFEKNFYHIPVDFIEDPQRIKYIALYRSKNIFGEADSGIMHYASVISCDLVKRFEITEIPNKYDPEREYYRFSVSDWQRLDVPVAVKEIGPRVCMMTNIFLLQSSLCCYELYISSNNELKLHLGLSDIVRGTYDGFFVGDVRVRTSGKKIIVTAPKARKVFLKEDYYTHTLSVLKKISDIVFDDSFTIEK